MTNTMYKYDKQFAGLVAGVDEAGRGPLAGPVVCAACILQEQIEGINDSKKLSAAKREVLYQLIVKKAIAYSVAIVSSQTIDDINILQATKKGMVQAILELDPKPQIVLVDHVKVDLGESFEVVPITKGDTISYSIAAASIIAKVTRDRLMLDLHAQYPQYGFDKHKGYGTKQHYYAIKRHGVTPQHRESFLNKL